MRFCWMRRDATMAVRLGEGEGGSDRVTLIWPDMVCSLPRLKDRGPIEAGPMVVATSELGPF